MRTSDYEIRLAIAASAPYHRTVTHNRKKMNRFNFLILILLIIGCKENQPIESNNKIELQVTNQTWTYENAKEYNSNQFDSTKWNIKMLKSEIEYVDNDPWPTQPPISKLPFPVAKYGPGYNGYASKGLSLTIGEKNIKGGTFAASTNKNSIEPKYNPNKSNIIFFNILVLTDKPESENSSLRVSSRNYPHHTCQGRRKTSIGNIDWFAMHMASGVKFAIVNTKYFNLDFGQTVLVAPQKDGSLRFKQINLPTLATDEIDEQIDRLGEQEDIIKFFTNPKNI